jgi:hypothetical protein
MFRLNLGQESREVSAHGNAARVFRAGLQTPSLEATFRNDTAAGSVEVTLRPLSTITSTGFTIVARKDAGASSATNLNYTGTYILDGDLNVLDEDHGEVAEITAKFLLYSGTVVASSS